LDVQHRSKYSVLSKSYIFATRRRHSEPNIFIIFNFLQNQTIEWE